MDILLFIVFAVFVVGLIVDMFRIRKPHIHESNVAYAHRKLNEK